MVLDGEIDRATAPWLAATLVASVTPCNTQAGVIVDPVYVEFIDSTGLDALIAVRDHLRAGGEDLRCAEPEREHETGRAERRLSV